MFISRRESESTSLLTQNRVECRYNQGQKYTVVTSSVCGHSYLVNNSSVSDNRRDIIQIIR